MHAYIPGKILDGIQVFVAFREDSSDLLLYELQGTILEGFFYTKNTLFDLCTMEIKKSKLLQTEPASLNHDLLLQPEFTS